MKIISGVTFNYFATGKWLANFKCPNCEHRKAVYTSFTLSRVGLWHIYSTYDCQECNKKSLISMPMYMHKRSSYSRKAALTGVLNEED